MMAQADLISATSSFKGDCLGADGGWKRYTVKQAIYGDRKLGLFVIFSNGQLKTASFAYANRDESWDTWSEEGELAREKEYRQELERQLGGKRSFASGKAAVKLYSKSGGTGIWSEDPCARTE